MNEEELTKKLKEKGVSIGDEIMVVISDDHQMKGTLDYNCLYNGFFVRNRHGFPITVTDFEVVA